MTAPFTVFLCSTFSDLSEEREAVLDAIRRLRLLHDSMEFFGALADRPIETCLKEVCASDILVVVVGHRYGSLASNLGISYSEAEYSEGFCLKKPCLVYMRDENVPILPRHIERDPEKLKLLEKWKATLQSRHTVAAFVDGSRLAVQVAADLARTIQDLEEVAEARVKARSAGEAGMVAGFEKQVVVLTYGADARNVILYVEGELRRAGFFVFSIVFFPQMKGGCKRRSAFCRLHIFWCSLLHRSQPRIAGQNGSYRSHCTASSQERVVL